MLRVNLKWSVVPESIYEYKAQVKRKKGYFDPVAGKGVYLFIHGNGKRYQIYYIGMSDDDIGTRLACHYEKYAGLAVSDYLLPKEAALFNGDIYTLFNDDQKGEKYFKREGEGFSNAERRKVGEEIMKNTYFAFARVTDDLTENIKDIEACLQHAVQKKSGLNILGWIGGKTSGKPSIALEIENIYTNNTMEKMISTTLPDIIRCDKQCSTEIFSREPE